MSKFVHFYEKFGKKACQSGCKTRKATLKFSLRHWPPTANLFTQFLRNLTTIYAPATISWCAGGVDFHAISDFFSRRFVESSQKQCEDYDAFLEWISAHDVNKKPLTKNEVGDVMKILERDADKGTVDKATVNMLKKLTTCMDSIESINVTTRANIYDNQQTRPTTSNDDLVEEVCARRNALKRTVRFEDLYEDKTAPREAVGGGTRQDIFDKFRISQATPIEMATRAHQFGHVPWKTLTHLYNITAKSAKEIVSRCNNCMDNPDNHGQSFVTHTPRLASKKKHVRSPAALFIKGHSSHQ